MINSKKNVLFVVQGLFMYIILDRFTNIGIREAVLLSVALVLVSVLTVQLYGNKTDCPVCNDNSCNSCKVEKFEGEEQTVEEPVEPAVEEPVVEPAVEEPAVEEQAVEEPAVEEPDNKYYWGGRPENDNEYGFGGMYYDTYPYPNKKDSEWDDSGRRLREKEYIEKLKKQLDKRARELDGYDTPYQKVGNKSEYDKTLQNRRGLQGELDDELPYSDYNHLPVASGYKSHDYEYGYSFMPPEKWYPQPPRPPVCVTEKRCPVCPTYTNGAPIDVKEFHSSRRVTPPDMINTEYIGDKLNAGR